MSPDGAAPTTAPLPRHRGTGVIAENPMLAIGQGSVRCGHGGQIDEPLRHLARRYRRFEFIRFARIASVPADFTDQFLNRCHVVATAFGD